MEGSVAIRCRRQYHSRGHAGEEIQAGRGILVREGSPHLSIQAGNTAELRSASDPHSARAGRAWGGSMGGAWGTLVVGCTWTGAVAPAYLSHAGPADVFDAGRSSILDVGLDKT